ncbi:MAG TPA: threonine-phosphate decarboxylase CobD [Roseiarcus sp.]
MTAATPFPGFEALAYHGGDLAVARRLAPDAPEPWIDLSTGINPHPYPLPVLAPEAWTRLPDRESVARLEAAAAARYSAPDPAQLVAAAGSQQIIQTLARLLPARRVGVLGATYAGHERAWRAAGAVVERVEDAVRLADFDVGVIVNPNNPDGRVVDKDRLFALAEALAAHGRTLIVDEAFMDFDASVQSLAPNLPDGAIVLRSFGKAYGVAGLRLGFAVAPLAVADRLRAALGPWAVSGPAIAIGRLALADAAWLASAQARLAADAARLDWLLVDRGWTILGGTKLFRLAERRDARVVFERLLRAGVLTRPFAESPQRLRFGLPATGEHWERLTAALAG